MLTNAFACDPEILKMSGAHDTCIVFVDRSNPGLSRKNIALAEKIIKAENKKCFKAIKGKRKWKLEPVK